MGYRSNVTIAFYTNDPSKLPFPALKLWFDENYPHATATTEWEAKITTGGHGAKDEDPHDYILIEYEDVKWYSGYEHPTKVQEAFDLFVETFDQGDLEQSAAYEFVRVGEEAADIEESTSTWCGYRLGVKREIYFD